MHPDPCRSTSLGTWIWENSFPSFGLFGRVASTCREALAAFQLLHVRFKAPPGPRTSHWDAASWRFWRQPCEDVAEAFWCCCFLRGSITLSPTGKPIIFFWGWSFGRGNPCWWKGWFTLSPTNMGCPDKRSIPRNLMGCWFLSKPKKEVYLLSHMITQVGPSGRKLIQVHSKGKCFALPLACV